MTLLGLGRVASATLLMMQLVLCSGVGITSLLLLSLQLLLLPHQLPLRTPHRSQRDRVARTRLTLLQTLKRRRCLLLLIIIIRHQLVVIITRSRHQRLLHLQHLTMCSLVTDEMMCVALLSETID